MLVGLVALAIAGCTKAASVEKPEVVAIGNDICRSGLAEVDEQLEAVPKEDQADAERHIRREVVAAYRNMMNELRGLGAPDGEGDYLEALYADAESGVALVEDQPSEALDGQLQPFPGLDQRFDNYGLSHCDLGSSLTPTG